jgi:transcriptional regulator with XRE-family HTH domain
LLAKIGFTACIYRLYWAIMKKQGDIQAVVGQRIRKLRRARGFTQQELGEYAGLNYKFLGEIERGIQNPTIQTLYKIANALGTELYEVVRVEEDSKDRQAIESSIVNIMHDLSDEELRQLLTVLKVLFPVKKEE